MIRHPEVIGGKQQKLSQKTMCQNTNLGKEFSGDFVT